MITQLLKTAASEHPCQVHYSISPAGVDPWVPRSAGVLTGPLSRQDGGATFRAYINRRNALVCILTRIDPLLNAWHAFEPRSHGYSVDARTEFAH